MSQLLPGTMPLSASSPTVPTVPVSSPMLDTIDALIPVIREHADQAERDRRLPAELVEQCRRAGLFRMLVPESHGGLEVDVATGVEVLRRLARADGAAAWTMMIFVESPLLLAHLDRQAFDQVYQDGPDVTIAGAFAPKGTAEAVDGGYRISGQWPFATGCEHADLLFGNCIIPPRSEGGGPELRCMILPRSRWTILDTWHTAGMRGTGSHDIAVNDELVADDRSFDLFGGATCLPGPQFAGPLLQFSLHIGSVALGIAEGALSELIELAGTGKTRLYGRTAMAEGELFQYHVGHAEAELRAAEALLFGQVAEHQELARAGMLGPAHLPRVLQATAWVVETAIEAASSCYRAGGGSAVYESSPLQRRLRDSYTLGQHASAQATVFADAGAARLLG